jgi:hypothetical protein
MGSLPTASPVSPGDIVATIYRLLGVDHQHVLYDSLDRPHAVVPKANVVKELIA